MNSFLLVGRLILFGPLLAAVPAQAAAGWTPPPPSPVEGLQWTNAFFPETPTDAAVPTPASLLGFELGARAATPAEIERCLHAWTNAAPDRTRLVEYARSHEGRPLHYIVITAPTHLARLEAIQEGYARLGDPRNLSEAGAEELLGGLPPVAWLAYTIHGDETEGSDAALAVIHHLVAAADPASEALRRDLVVIVDPLMNPDGRQRFLDMIAQHRGVQPNLDDQSLVHTGRWPYGRGNHYYFDLNRDMIYGTQPESRGRIRAIAQWTPLLFVDAHGMGPQDTHLFSPPREPLHPHITAARRQWGDWFAREQAAAFDRHGLVYYNGEWNDSWFPGYTDEWAAFRGVVGILYEQARVAENGVRRRGGRILSYRESVFHHIIGSMANLRTFQARGRDIQRSFLETRRTAVDPSGPFGNLTYAVLPTPNDGRRDYFQDLLRLQGIACVRTDAAFTAPRATNQLGLVLTNVTVPAGTLLVPARQPLAHLVAALLEFDPRIPPAALEEERREILRKGESRMYDVSAWNLTMYFGLETWVLPLEPTVATHVPWEEEPWPLILPSPADRPTVAWVISGADDRALPAAARLLERGFQVRVAKKDFRLGDQTFPRGSILLLPIDNRPRLAEVESALTQVHAELRLRFTTVETGFGVGELPDLGSEQFVLLDPPRVALMADDATASTDLGAIRFVLDHELGIRHSPLAPHGEPDLGRYNVLIVPARGKEPLPGNLVSAVQEWVRQGGTLVAIGSAASTFLTPGTNTSGFVQVKTLPDVLDRLPEYELAVLREWLAQSGPPLESEGVWSHQANLKLRYPWSMVDGGHPEEKELKRREAWQALWMPQGAILAGRVDTNHWLTAGASTVLPVLVGGGPVLMAATGVEAPVRYGVFTPAEAQSSKSEESDQSDQSDQSDKSDKSDKAEPPRVGWAGLPPGYALQLRMSGLLWPEAAHRLANAAWVTRESVGRGQVILFASPPAFRAATHGTSRILLNAIVTGPGCGTEPPLIP